MHPLLKKHDKNSIGLIGHTIINYPSPEECEKAIAIMVEAGVDLIELQIPFSEPVADGPLFLKANHEALEAGVSVAQCFNFMHRISKKYNIPFVFMTYVNILYKKGFENFVQAAAAAGAKGLIVPDLPVEMATDYLAACTKYAVAAIGLIPPNVTGARLQKIAEAAQGFIYAVARAGVTGSKTEMNKELIAFVERIRHHSELPIAVGFGIATAADIEFLKPHVDYAIVGSQALRVLKEKGLSELRRFWHELKRAAEK